MDFKDYVRNLSERAVKLKDSIKTEEATKNALIMPFIQTLGYDVFNPVEVVPEFIADIGAKKGEKVDYAIFKEDNPVMIIECKHWNDRLEVHDTQLLRYFHVTKTKFAVLTNGFVYKFYTDLEEPNKMDTFPFLEFNLLDIKDIVVEELKKFHKSYFDVGQIVSAASDMKYTSGIKTILHSEFNNPSENFVRFLAKQVYQGPITEKVVTQFMFLVKKSVGHWMTDMLNDKLKTALSTDQDLIVDKQASSSSEKNDSPVLTEDGKDSRIVTTEIEMESFYIVKSILRTVISPEKITFKDTISYFGILYGDNSRKTICRLYLNTSKYYLGIFDESKKETKMLIGTIDEIYNHKEALIKIAKVYESMGVKD